MRRLLIPRQNRPRSIPVKCIYEYHSKPTPLEAKIVEVPKRQTDEDQIQALLFSEKRTLNKLGNKVNSVIESHQKDITLYKEQIKSYKIKSLDDNILFDKYRLKLADVTEAINDTKNMANELKVTKSNVESSLSLTLTELTEANKDRNYILELVSVLQKDPNNTMSETLKEKEEELSNLDTLVLYLNNSKLEQEKTLTRLRREIASSKLGKKSLQCIKSKYENLIENVNNQLSKNQQSIDLLTNIINDNACSIIKYINILDDVEKRLAQI